MSAPTPDQDVGAFLRLHRHFPDPFCGGDPAGRCEYREDGVPINAAGLRIESLLEDPRFVAEEKEVQNAVAAKWDEMGWDSRMGI